MKGKGGGCGRGEVGDGLKRMWDGEMKWKGIGVEKGKVLNRRGMSGVKGVDGVEGLYDDGDEKVKGRSRWMLMKRDEVRV